MKAFTLRLTEVQKKLFEELAWKSRSPSLNRWLVEAAQEKADRQKATEKP